MAGMEEAPPCAVESETTIGTAMETERDVKEAVSDPICKGESMVGCYVGKKDAEVRGILLGKVASFNPDSNLYSVVYEDGERVGMDRVQLCDILMAEDGGAARLKMSCRKRKLDLLVSEEVKKNLSDVCDGPDGTQVSDVSDNVDSSSNSCESAGRDMIMDLHSSEPVVMIQVPELPPSSGDIAVPDESVGHLFSVYNFLRSFSAQLFLSPFTLSDFVGSLICGAQNSLLDAVHLSLMKALRRHLEALSSDGSKLASKCLRYHDWTLLDTLTWPVFLLEFLYVMGYVKHLGGQRFGVCLLTGEYYLLPVSVKLKILQIGCDEVVDSADLKTELEKREEYSEDAEYDSDASILPAESSMRRGRPRKEAQVLVASGSHEPTLSKKEGSLDVGQDGNSDECRICGMDGMLICCDGCPWAYHSRCIGLNKASLPEGQWFCPECSINKLGPTSARIERGREGPGFSVSMFLDGNSSEFAITCLWTLPDAEPYYRYYNKSDVPKILYRLSSNGETTSLFVEICRGISEYWDDISAIKEELACGGSVPSIESSKGNIVLLPQKDEKFGNFSSGFVTCSTISQNSIARIPNVRGPTLKSSVKLVPTFRPHAYQNQYAHGEVSASSAVTHAVLSAEESNNSKSVDASNPRKAVHQMTVLQMKAFASAALQFVWPSVDRRQMEVPRERCGWCIVCKGATAHKRGCLLNLAASNATKASARSLSGLRPMNKQEDSHLPSIANYLASMEESLQGLIDGPLLDPPYRQWWRNKLKEANDCRALKFLLLELERCIRGVAMSNVWFKLVDQWSVDLSGTNAGGATQRRGGSGGRRSRKRAVESASGASDYSWKELQWWRGGKLSNALLQRFSLSRSFTRKAARQGGLRKIVGVSYHDSSEYPRINRQCAWRSSVEMSKSTSHLALQVRYLNAHIRWRELMPPDQIPTDGKAAEADAAVFRNAAICDKKKVENKTIYALKFNNQKHLPVRVTKNILETENSDDENSGKLWFYENHIPLYLIKAYEERAAIKPLQNPNSSVPNCSPNFERKRVQMYYRDIFMYLYERGERPIKVPCASCRQEVLLRNVVRCGTCQGDCHDACVLASAADVMCKSCHSARLARLANSKMVQIRQTIPPPQEMKKVEKLEPVQLRSGTPHVLAQLVPNMPVEAEPKSGLKRKKPVSGDPAYYGLRWRKKQNETGMEFRLEHIVLKCKEGTNSSRQPICCLCKKPYCPSLMYIRCEKCFQWFHADSVELEESQVSELVGFKCGKCRRKVQPRCPYVDNNIKKKSKTNNGFAQPSTPNDSFAQPLTPNDSFAQPSVQVQPPLSRDDDFMLLDDPLLSSYGTVEPVEPIEPISLSKSSQKLSVRRAAQMKNDTLLPPQSNIQAATDSEDLNDVSVSSELQWDSSSQGDVYITAADADSNYGWIEPNVESREEDEDDGFEPQTYFSFTELLAPEDNNNTHFEDSNNQIGAVFDELLSNSVQEDEAGKPSLEGELVVCDKCKAGEPAPDRTCGICGLCIHTHCSPWIETDASYQNGQWKCGDCREWR